MPRVCGVCQHPERAAIDQALVAGTPARQLASRYGTLSRMAFWRHREDHIPVHLAKAQEAAEVAQADRLLDEVRALRAKAVALLLKAEQAGDYRTALLGVREARACVETLLEVEGELDRRPTVNLLVAPEWLAVRTALLAALGPYPEARQAVATALGALERTNGHPG
jgi:hypothetical protein